MGRVDVPRNVVFPNGKGDHHIQPQKGKVCEILLIQRLSLKMSVDETQPSQSQDSGSISGELWNGESLLVTDDHEGDGSSSFDENTDLPPDFSREVAEKTGQFRGNDLLRRNSPPVNVLQSSQLVRFQADDVSIDPSDWRSPLFWKAV
jgi:hypothetical protein